MRGGDYPYNIAELDCQRCYFTRGFGLDFGFGFGFGFEISVLRINSYCWFNIFLFHATNLSSYYIFTFTFTSFSERLTITDIKVKHNVI